MERKHGYSLSAFADLTEEGEDKLFDLCEKFMSAPGNKLENNDWQILGEQNAQISIANKHTFINYTVYVDIDKEFSNAMHEYAEFEKKEYENSQRINQRLLKAIQSVKGERFVNDLKDYLEDSADVIGPWEIVRETKGNYQEEDYNSLKGLWVDQWRNGGYEGDDFAGHIYIELKKDRYLKMYYSC